MAAPVRIFISAGEASGDSYGASLMEALGERLGGVEFFGCGGERMRAAGCRTVVDARQIAMVGLVEVIPGLRRAWNALRSLRQAIDHQRPQLAILIDFPDFNLRLAKHLKRAGVPIVYFVAPQVWAWRTWRVRTIRRTVSRLLCIFPFEEEFFRRAGVVAEFVGHPLVEQVQPRLSAAEYRARLEVPPNATLIALLPGSRKKEIELNLPGMLEAARLLAAERECHFVVPSATTIQADWLRARVTTSGIRVTVVEDLTYDALAHAAAAIVASGTAATEAALLGTPMAIVYRVSGLSWLLGRWLVSVPFYSMVNLVAGRQIVPEFIQQQFQPRTVAREIGHLLDTPPLRHLMQDGLQDFKEKLRRVPRDAAVPSGGGGATGVQILDPIQRSAAIAESILKERG